MRKEFNYKKELYEAARANGYASPAALIKDQYAKGLSFNRIGYMLGRSGPWVRVQSQKIGIKARSRGGFNHKGGVKIFPDQFRVTCKRCNAQIDSASYSALRKGMMEHVCK